MAEDGWMNRLESEHVGESGLGEWGRRHAAAAASHSWKFLKEHTMFPQ